MKKLIVLTFALILANSAFAQTEFIFPKASDHPKLAATGKTIEDFVPKSWELYQKECGDLNGDRLADCAIVVNGTYKKFIQKHDGFGTNPFDTNPVIFAVLFKEKNGYRLALQNNSIAAVAEGPTASYPFAAMSIEKKVLKIDFEHFMSAGGWDASYSKFKFKWIGGEFQMIGADKTEYARNSGQGQERSYDFIAKKIKIITGDMIGENAKTKTRWRKLPAKFKARTLSTYKGPGSWEIEHDYFL